MLLAAFTRMLFPFYPSNLIAQDKATVFTTSSEFSARESASKGKIISAALLTSLKPGSTELDSLIKAAESDGNIHIKIISLDSIKGEISLGTGEFRVLWIHSDDSAYVAGLAKSPNFLRKIKMLEKSGLGLWLTHEACRLVVALGWEQENPQAIEKNILDEGYGRMAGYHARLSHPIFAGLNNGCYVLKPRRDFKTKVLGYFEGKKPLGGRVVATDWDYIFLREDKKVIWEYTFQRSKALVTGGYLYFAEPNINKPHLKRFTSNCLRYLAGDSVLIHLPSYYWDYDQPRITWMEEIILPTIATQTIDNQKDTLQAPLQHTKPADDAYIQVSGSRIIAMGNEKAGISEIWSHPFMALRDYSIRLVLPDTVTDFRVNNAVPLVTIEPGYFSRQYLFRKDTLIESLSAHPDSGVWVAHYEWKGSQTARIEISFRSNLRLMWPYSEKVNPEIKVGWDKSKRVLCMTDETGKYAVVAGSLAQPVQHKAIRDSVSEELAIKARFEYELTPNKNLDFVVAAGSQGLVPQLRLFTVTAADALGFNKVRKQRLQSFFGQHLKIITPDENLNEAWKWLMAGVNSFYIETPNMARSLVAGHNTTGTGWDGGHSIDGRPGYAWYFGRDAEWSSMALLHYGDFEKVKEVLLTLAAFQDLNGKIFHELTTTGFAHYDAADATPLFIVLAGRYYKHSGDTALIKLLWPALYKAYQFCLSTDTDHDHLIENTNVGHGWVEGGPLFGSHTSLYLASCWNEALISMAELAKCMNDTALSRQCKREALIVNKIINNDFWNDDLDHFHQGLMVDGSWHTLASVMPAVPSLFGQFEEKKLQSFINLTAGNEYTTNYGSRIISKLSPYYRPNGYHSGSVWPLFTGWHALAAWKANRPETAQPLTFANLMIYNDWGFGYSEEVLNGDVYKSSGVCRHQCWSETMALQPVIEGMLGFQPDAPHQALTITPNLPANWNFIEIQNLRCGNASININMQKNEASISWTFIPSQGSVNINFRPVFNYGATVGRITVNGKTIPFEIKAFGKNGRYPDISFSLNEKTEIRIEYLPGFAILTPNPDLKPGAAPEGLRIIDAQADMKAATFVIETEIPQNSRHTLLVEVPDEVNYKVENAEIVNREGKILTLSIESFHETSPFIRKMIKVYRSK